MTSRALANQRLGLRTAAILVYFTGLGQLQQHGDKSQQDGVRCQVETAPHLTVSLKENLGEGRSCCRKGGRHRAPGEQVEGVVPALC